MFITIENNSSDSTITINSDELKDKDIIIDGNGVTIKPKKTGTKIVQSNSNLITDENKSNSNNISDQNNSKKDSYYQEINFDNVAHELAKKTNSKMKQESKVKPNIKLDNNQIPVDKLKQILAKYGKKSTKENKEAGLYNKSTIYQLLSNVDKSLLGSSLTKIFNKGLDKNKDYISILAIYIWYYEHKDAKQRKLVLATLSKTIIKTVLESQSTNNASRRSK